MPKPKVPKASENKEMKTKALAMVLLGVLALGWSLNYLSANMVALVVGVLLVVKGLYKFLSG